MADQSTTTSSTSVFTDAETKFVLAALRNVKGGKLDIDFDGLAAELGLKDATTTRARWNTINRTKIQSTAPAGGVDKASPAKKNTKPKKTAAQNGAGELKTPKKRASKKKGATIKVESPKAELGSDADADGEEDI